jgi:hypothetical protein
MNRLAPWQRINIALARGILLKASGTMKWTANIQVFGVTPDDGSPLSIFPIEADTEIDAARSAAKSTALALFGREGEAGFVNQTEPHLYMATVGVYFGGGIGRGRSAQILIREYHGVQ